MCCIYDERTNGSARRFNPVTPFILSRRSLNLTVSIPFCNDFKQSAEKQSLLCSIFSMPQYKLRQSNGKHRIASYLLRANCEFHERCGSIRSEYRICIYRPLIQMITTIIMNLENEPFNGWKRAFATSHSSLRMRRRAKWRTDYFTPPPPKKKNNMYLKSTRNFCSNVNL